jgi:hypothetical protein
LNYVVPAQVDKLDESFGLDGGDDHVHVLGHSVIVVELASGFTGDCTSLILALHHLVHKKRDCNLRLTETAI